MHEHGIADHLLADARAMAAGQGLRIIKRIQIGVGALSGLERETLEGPLRHAAEEMGMAGVDFIFQRVLPSAVCRHCGKDAGQEYRCPACGSEDLEITGGLNAFVQAVE